MYYPDQIFFFSSESITNSNLTKEEQDLLAAQKMALKIGILPSNGAAVVANFRPNPTPTPKRKRWDVK